ncbi:hypothetical protein C8D77_10347 [Mesorhizobium loti]|uniref:Uncharacterized protein n=1 Tax=Rhizobium loti TaxID=381 RepID=A0A8E2WCB3_RHILI|nr:hypothetical protein C8D77_10347 [Mesorhizobium loti]
MVMWWPLIVDSNSLMSIRILYLAPGTRNAFSNPELFEAWICVALAEGGILVREWLGDAAILRAPFVPRAIRKALPCPTP